ncbi:sulfurtransferase TusA family protein [Brevundimonas sp. S30B]|uniref:sulfurtransferase TusA family protein n=1 Tax=unclassified Brevundimonas TaxID=2622653 RepID=UPI001071C6D4|nr:MULTISPECIES: sulfurtransferase TusA family protein [unclassified Brevundimonas]QBX37901.1 sulfurtransferase TusA family protein [Brevundimonas sp. MF30-B]TFW02744.1 sulfurtransferase TusA family protein [Brevundimonas sp. S30B]
MTAEIVDARGHRCPTPSLRLRRAMSFCPPRRQLKLLATDPMARIDVPFLVAQLGGRVLSIEEVDGELAITVETPAAPKD